MEAENGLHARARNKKAKTCAKWGGKRVSAIACLAMLSKADLVTLVFMMVTFAARAMPPIDHFDGRTLAAFGMYGVVDLF